MIAVIETGGKQYLITPQQQIKIEKLNNVKEGDEITFDKVLLLVDDENNIKIGKPYLEGVTVSAQITKAGREKKVIVFRYHSKTRYHKKKGHRQPYMKAIVKEIH
jgi:large subunit ribosomal protein L21